jgi:hypothetical protein
VNRHFFEAQTIVRQIQMEVPPHETMRDYLIRTMQSNERSHRSQASKRQFTVSRDDFDEVLLLMFQLAKIDSPIARGETSTSIFSQSVKKFSPEVIGVAIDMGETAMTAPCDYN